MFTAFACSSFLVLALAAPPLHTFFGFGPADRAGSAVAGVGDLDGDGAADLIVGAPHAATNGPAAGLVRVFSGRRGTELMRFAGQYEYQRLGASVAGVGDIDGDGIPDLAFGAPTGTPPEGSVSVRSGRDGSELWHWVGELPGDRFGGALAGAGDVDGDGWPDVIVGAPHHDGIGPQAGRAIVYSGASGAVLLVIEGQAWDFLGTAVAAAGDLDGDGCDDVLVGAPFSDVGAFNSGSARVYSGSDGSVLLEVHGTGIGDQLGFRLSGGVDVDGDGWPDLALAVPGSDLGGIDSGAVQLHSGADGSLRFAVAGGSSGDGMSAVAFCGDIDGDGAADLLAGAASASGVGAGSGKAWVLSGRDGSLLAEFAGRSAGDWLGAAVAGIGDLDGDGVPDLAVGAPGHDDDLSKRGYVQVFPGS